MSNACEVRDKYVNEYKKIHLRMMTYFSSVGLDVALKVIDEGVLSDWREQWKDSVALKFPNGSWNWEELNRKYASRCKRLDLAIYHNGNLEGLVLGKITKGRLVIRIDYLQGSPLAESALKGQITSIATVYATYVGLAVDATHISIVNPVNYLVEEHYRKYGFEYDRPFGRFIKNTMYREITEE